MFHQIIHCLVKLHELQPSPGAASESTMVLASCQHLLQHRGLALKEHCPQGALPFQAITATRKFHLASAHTATTTILLLVPHEGLSRHIWR